MYKAEKLYSCKTNNFFICYFKIIFYSDVSCIQKNKILKLKEWEFKLYIYLLYHWCL